MYYTCGSSQSEDSFCRANQNAPFIYGVNCKEPFDIVFIRSIFLKPFYMYFLFLLNLASLMGAFIPVAMGVGDGIISDDAMRASSVLDRYHIPSQARLNNTKQRKSGGAWKPKINDKNQYLELDLGAVTNVWQVCVCSHTVLHDCISFGSIYIDSF